MTKLVILAIAIFVASAEGTCLLGCHLPITIYKDLKCRPVYSNSSDCCPSEYDCSHIYNRPQGTCHFKGKLYKSGEMIAYEDSTGSCESECRCQSGSPGSQFFCPRHTDGCAELWVGNYPGPGCYLRRELNQCCAAGQVCPPFDEKAKCEINGKFYREGEIFDHPTLKCKKCVCKKSPRGKFEELFCDDVHCYAELHNSEAISNNCAPFYKSSDSCCPDKWICADPNKKILPPTYNRASQGSLKCRFGKETIAVGKTYEAEAAGEKIYCECVIPPLLICGPQPIKS